ncbi:signal peptidase I [Nocardioides sp. KR10-350]|uniref:signal peptidase I n=1 Tax=Nocardioides cheoyonin TaxID=3156615 RepID=UPI0032B60BD1
MTSDDRDPSSVEVEPDGLEPDDREGSRSSRSEARTGRSHLPLWQETILLVVIAVVVAVVVKQFFLQAFYIPSESMEPGLVDNDRILVEKPSYWLGGEPQRGDVVVFSDPGGWLDDETAGQPGSVLTKGLAKIGLYPTGGHLVKRVIGVAGDTIRCCDKHGRIEVNGKPLDEPYARPGRTPTTGAKGGVPCYGPMPGILNGSCSWKAGPVPKGYVFVMGDNRAHSADSTVHLCTDQVTECSDSPYVPVHDVVGKVFALAWPLGRAHWEHRPKTFDSVPNR